VTFIVRIDLAQACCGLGSASLTRRCGTCSQIERCLPRGNLVLAPGIEVHRRSEVPAARILEQVRSSEADLVVMGTYGRSGPGRWLYGSVADQVLRASPVPVILVPPAVTTAWPSWHLRRTCGVA